MDESFYGMLETLVGKDVLEKFQSVCKYDHLHMLRQFEIEKRPVSHDKDIVIKIKISRCFQNLIKELTGRSIADKIAQSELKRQNMVHRRHIKYWSGFNEGYFPRCRQQNNR